MANVLQFKRGSSARDEALEWLLARREGLDAQRAREFARWLTASPEHAREYQAMERLAEDLGRISPGHETATPADPATNDAPGTRWFALAAVVAFVAIALALVGRGFWPLADGNVQELRYATSRGEVRQEQLEDGSGLWLDTGTVVTQRYSGSERLLVLEQGGRANFNVWHDDPRRFVVETALARIEDIGTRFDVYARDGATEVTVLEGRVKVSATSRTPAFGTLELEAGQRVLISAGDPVAALSRVDVEHASGWMRREINVRSEPLSTLIDEYNRYLQVPIRVASPEVGRLTITGPFPLDDVEYFLDFLRKQQLRVEVRQEQIIVSGN